VPLTLLIASALALSVSDPAAARTTHKRNHTFSGRLELFHTDPRSGGPDTYTYELKSGRGRHYVLRFARRVHPPLPGSRVTLRGRRRGRRILVKRILSVSAHSASLSSPNRKLAVILLNFQDNRSETYTPEEVRQIVWTNPDSIRAYFSESSFGQLQLDSVSNPEGDVYGYYTIPYKESEGCAPQAWGEAAMAAARNAGVDLSGYTNIMFDWPEAGCPFSGAAEVGGSLSWINGELRDPDHLTAAHELGHNFGLRHAHSLICHDAAGNVVPYNPNQSYCHVEEYGDPYDVMGEDWHYEFNDYFKGVLGWWPSSAVQTVTASGTYLLQPDETDGEGIHVLRIRRPEGSAEQQYYYLEFRQPSLFDNWATRFKQPMSIEEGVAVRLAGDFSSETGSELLNMNPTTVPPSYSIFEWFAPLTAGATYTDPTSGVEIKTDSTTPAGASVSIAFPSTSRNPTPPAVSIAAPGGGTTVSGLVPITANASDSGGVASVALAVDGKTVATPTSSPYSASWNTTAVPNGTHTVTATAKDSAGATASSSITVTVANATVPSTNGSSDTTPPSAPSGVSALALSATQAAISWKPSSDNVGVTKYEVLRNGARVAVTASARLVDSGLIAGKSFSYQVRAYDAAGNASSPSSSVRLNTPPVKTTGALAGWATSSATGAPINGVKVTANLGGHSWSANTNAAGFYLIPNLAPGAYTVVAAAAGHAPEITSLTVVTGLATLAELAL
jgi:hypothetical protein